MALLTACASKEDVVSPTYTVGENDNVITLRAGIREGGSGVETRAAEVSHDKHLAFTNGTKATLRIDGTWNGHSTEPVSQTTIATIGAETAEDSKHNAVTMSPMLYWDDYGTADPDNMGEGKGRAKGLTIYGVAVNGITTDPIVGDNWNSLSWALDANQTSGWTSKDLLTSNNIKDGNDGTLKFDAVKSGNASDLLVFTHAMSKMTVILTADEGFPGYSSTTSNAVFEANPTVTLLGFNISGTYNVETKTPSASTTSTIQMHLSEGGASNHTATFDALVFPGNNWTEETKGTEILELNADGNIYKVTAEKLFEAMNSKSHTAIKQGYDYVLNIIVKKTKIVVEATIKDWVDVTAESVTPEINISANYGQQVNGNAFTRSFDLYRSLNIASGYDEDASTEGINPAATYTYSSSSGSWNKTIFWPNHDTHYFFRGIYPTNQTVTTDGDYDVITVQNTAFSAASAPSELMIALPRSTGTCESHGTYIETNGICATKGTITMNFEYAMSKIELRLKSTGTSGSDYVDLSREGTEVEIIQGYTKGKIKLEDGLHSDYSDSDKGNYPLSKLSTAAEGCQMTTLDAVMPQVLGDDVLFKITVTNADGTHDVYHAQVNTIKGAKNGETPALITEWKHGEHYIYTLDVKKSQIFVSATITDWTTVDASDDVWM